jgi:hypothetical protein
MLRMTNPREIVISAIQRDEKSSLFDKRIKSAFKDSKSLKIAKKHF